MASTRQPDVNPPIHDFHIGFRVATVIPEPSTLLLVALAGMGLLRRRRGASLRSQRSAD
jgi:hypothetical protein